MAKRKNKVVLRDNWKTDNYHKPLNRDDYEQDENGEFTNKGLADYLRQVDANNKKARAAQSGPSSNVTEQMDQRLSNNAVESNIPKTAGNYSPEAESGFDKFMYYKNRVMDAVEDNKALNVASKAVASYEKAKHPILERVAEYGLEYGRNEKEKEAKRREEEKNDTAYRNEKANALENMSADQFEALSKYNKREDFYKARGGNNPFMDNLADERQAVIDAGISEDKVEKYAQYVREKNNERETNKRDEYVKEKLNDDTEINKVFDSGLKGMARAAAGYVEMKNPILGDAANYALDQVKDKTLTRGDVANMVAAPLDVIASPVVGMAATESLNKFNYADQRAKVDTNSRAYALQNLSNTIEQTQKENIADSIKKQGWSDTATKIVTAAGQGAYDLGMTTAKAGFSMAIGQAAGAAYASEITDVEEAAKAIKTVANILTLPSFGTSSYAQTLKEGYDRGLTESEAQKKAIVAGVAEMATEVLSLDMALDAYNKGGRKLLKEKIADAIAGSAVEGSEEFFNDIINEVADILITGDRSEFKQSVNNYVKEGLSEKDAMKQATADFFKGALKDFVMGTLSGGILQGGAAVLGSANVMDEVRMLHNEGNYREIENSIDVDPKSYANEDELNVAKKTKEMYKNLADKAENGETIKNHEQASAYELLQETMSNAQNTQSAIEDKFTTEEEKTQNTADSDVTELTKNIRTAQTEEELVKAEREAKAAGLDVAELVGLSSEMNKLNMDEVRRLESEPTKEEAYQMGYEGKEGKENLSDENKIAYNEGAMNKINEGLKNNSTSEPLTKAKATYNGKEITVQGVSELATTKDFVLKTSEGDIPATKVKFANKGTENLYKSALTYKGDTRTAFLDYYPGNSMPANSYVIAFKNIYDAGSIGRTFEKFAKNNIYVAAVGTENAKAIYELGKADEKKSRDKNRSTAKGKVTSGVVKDSRTNKPEEADALLEVAEAFAKKTGIEIELTDELEKGVNGSFEKALSKITIKNGTEKELKTLTHEYGEFIKAYDEENFMKLRNSVIGWYVTHAPEEFNRLMDDYERVYSGKYESQGRSITRGEVADEFVFDALSSIVFTEEGTQDFIKWAYEEKSPTEARNIIDILKDFFTKLFDHIMKFTQTQISSEQGDLIANNADIERLKGIRDNFFNIIDNAAKNYQKETLANAKEAKSDNIAASYSLDIDSDGNKLSEGQKEYFKNTKAVDEDGDLLKMYHGTVSDFTVFDRKYGNVEGDWGKGFYFTNMEYDADDNYGNEGGPDLTIKIERLADQLEWEEGFEDADYDERLEEAKKRLITGEAHTLSVYLNVTNPVYIRDNNSTLLFADLYDDIDYEEFEDEDEYYEALDNALADKYAYIEEKLNEAGFEDLGDVGSALYQAAEEGGVTAQQLKDMINQYYIGDDEGNLAGNEITRIIVEALGYDGIIDETVSTKFKGMHLDPDTKHIIVFNSNQAKNTDNLNPTENNDIRYSLEVDDKSYMAAVDNGDMETAQKMVDAYAKQTRWNSEKLYHGSDQFGFTVIDPTKGDDNISFFATNSEEIASTYTNGKTKEIGTKINEWKNLKGLELKKYANEHGLNIKYNFGDEQKNNLEVLKNNLSDMGWTKALEYLEDPLWKNKIIPALEDIALEDPSSNEFEKALEIIKEIEEDEEIDKHGIDFNEIKWTAIALKEAASLMFEHYGTPISEESVKIMLEQGERIGIYSLYGDTSNFMEIDGKGANWNTIGPEERGLFEAIFNVARANIAWDLEETEILEESKRSSFEEIAEKILEEEESNFTRKERFDLIHKAKRLDQMKSEYKGAISFEKYLSNQKIQNTRQLAKLAYNSGYSGVKIKNITDHGPKNFNLDAEAGDIYIFFKGQDIKSADPVTYDDNGEVIPLSKRFSEGNQDIRFSLDVDTEGRKLSEGQRKYFKDSKIVDEKGALKVMYHGTDQYGFTVFDAKKSDDRISLFFSDTKEVSNSYTRKGDLYEVYLNVKKPLVVDAKGAKWNNLILEDELDGKDEIILKAYDYINMMQSYDEAIDFGVLRESLGSLQDSLDYLLEEEKEYIQWNEEEISRLKELARELDDAYENWDEDDYLDEYDEPQSMSDYLYYNRLVKRNTRSISKYAKENGYDGVIFKEIRDTGKFAGKAKLVTSTVVIAFESNQVKSTDNLKPTENEDIRYSLDVSSFTKKLKRGFGKNEHTIKVDDDTYEFAQGLPNQMIYSNTFSEFEQRKEFYKKYQEGKANKDTFYVNTLANYKETSRPKRKPDYVSKTRDGKISSEYWYTDDGVIRGSNHWGNNIASCDWWLNGTKGNGYKQYGKANFSDFVLKGNIEEKDGYGRIETFSKILGSIKHGLGFREIITDWSDNLNPTENPDIRYSLDLGYHAGDLGKAERYASQGRNRGTGHFGTGTYFVGDEEKITESYKDRPQHAADFENYNLYKVKNDKEGYKLHDALKAIDGGVNEDFIEHIKNNDYAAIPLKEYSYISLLPEDIEEWSEEKRLEAIKQAAENAKYDEFITYEEWKEENADGEINEYIDEMDELIKENSKKINKQYEDLRDACDDLILTAARYNREKLTKALEDVAEYQKNTRADFDKMQDSLATVFMKSLGYEGVDVRGTGLDNTSYGSVIYDLKPESIVYSLDLDLPNYSNEIDDFVFNFGENDLGPLLKEGARLLEGQVVDKVSVNNIAKEIVKQNSSDYDAARLADNLEKVFAYMQSKQDISYGDLGDIMVEVARPVVEESRRVDAADKERYDNFIEYLKGLGGVRLSEKQKEEVRNNYGTYAKYRNSLFGKLNISDNGSITLDQIYDEMRKQSGHVLPEATEGDEPIALLEGIEAMRPTMINPYEENLDEAAYDVALHILHAYYDKAGNSKEIQALKKELRNQTKAFQTEVKAKYDKALENAIKNASANGETVNQAILKERARMRDRQAEQKERESVSKAKENIRRTANQLFNMLEKPSDKRHIPEALKTPVTQLLASIDFVSPRAKVDSKTSLKWQDMMRKLALDLKQITDNGEMMDDNSGQLASMCHIIDPDLADNMAQFVKSHENQTKLSNLSAAELKNLSNMMLGLKNAIVKSNELLGQKTSLEEVAKQSMREMDAKKERIDKNNFIKGFKDFFNLDMLDSISYFEEMGTASNSILKEIQEGWKNKVRRISEAQNWVEDELKEFGKTGKWFGDKAQKFTFKTEEGSIELSTGQLMELYAHSKREQSRGHFTRGGIRSGADRARSKVIHVTPELFNEMMSKLTPEQKAFTDKMQSYLSSDVASWGNNATMEAYGYKKFNEKNYWPIKTDSNTRNATDKNTSDNASLFAIRNMSASKNLVQGANNALELNDALATFTDHVSKMAAYEGLMIPLSDAMKWYNYHEQVDALDELGTRYDYGVKDSIERAYGKAGQNYFIKFMKDINGEAAGDKVPTFIAKMTSNAKAAAVSANLRVIIQQPTAIVRALNEMSGKYLMSATPSLFRAKKNALIAQDKSMLAKWKNWGYFDNYLGKSMQQVITGQQTTKEWIQDKAAMGAQLADDLTWGVLYKAVENEIKGTTDLTPGTKEFDDAVVKRFDYIIDRTQVVDTVFNRTQLMRSNNDLVKLSTAFMMEPSKSYNMLHRAIASGDKGKMFRAGMTYLLNAIVVSLAASIMDALRADDDETTFAERYLEALLGIGGEESGFKSVLGSTLGGNVNPLAQIPYVKELFSAIDGYDASRMDVAWIYDCYKAAEETYKYATDMKKDPAERTYKKTGWSVAEKIMKAAGESTGIPVYQAYRELKTAYNNIGNYFGLENIQTQKPGVYDKLEKAIVSGENVEAEVKALIDQGKETGDITGQLSKKYKAEYNALSKATDEESKEDFKELDANIRRAYTAAGYDKKAIDDTLEIWSYGDGKGSKYQPIYDAFDENKDFQTEIQKMMKEKGIKKGDMSRTITDKYKDQYLNNKTADFKNKLIRAYMACGYTRDESIKKINEWDKPKKKK